jgi:glycosyltransferase involved in cell wall biosynthesis
MSKISITYDHQTFAMQRYGGISRYFYETISRLVNDDDLEISLYLGHFINEYGLEKLSSEFNAFKGKKYTPKFKTKLLYLKLNDILFPKFLKKTDPDIYHQTYYNYLCPSFRGKRVMTILDMTHEYFSGSFSKLDKTSEWKKLSIPKADGLICISESTRQDLIKMFNVPEEKTRVIYLGNSVNPDISSERALQDNYILFVGDRKGYKNFLLLLNAYIELKDINRAFKLVCYGGGLATGQESEIISQNKLNSRVIFDGGNDKKLANYYKHASVFVYPSKYEGFGIPPLEAMSIGCPVIASNISSIPEVVGDGGLYIDPDSLDDMKEKLTLMLTDENLRKELVKKGLEQSKKFSWEKCAAEHLQFYKELLG